MREQNRWGRTEEEGERGERTVLGFLGLGSTAASRPLAAPWCNPWLQLQ